MPLTRVQNAMLNSGSATSTSSATSVTLTNASNQVQQIAMTAFGQSVILPDATTVSAPNGPVFIINNNGYIAFDVAASTGGRLFGVAPGQTVMLSLASTSSATAGWIATPIGQAAITQLVVDANPQNIFLSSMYTSGTTLLSNATADMNSTNSISGTTGYERMTCVALSTTSVMAVWIAPTTGYPTACIGTISGTTISWGTPAVVNNARAYTTLKMCVLSSTTGLIMMQSGANFYSIGFSVAGTTPTFSTISAAVVGTITAIATINSTTALFAYGSSRVVTYNGASAPTFGTALASTVTANLANTVSIYQLTATTFLIAYFDSNGAFIARVLTVSGTTVTQGTAVTVASVLSNPLQFTDGNLIGISSTEAVYVIGNQWQRWTVSGTTVTAGVGSYFRTFPAYQNQTWNNFIMTGVTSQLIGSTDFIALTPSQGIVRGSYNSASLSAKGYSLCANSCLPYAVCTVSTTRGLVVGLSTQSDGVNNYYPTGYLVDLNG